MSIIYIYTYIYKRIPLNFHPKKSQTDAKVLETAELRAQEERNTNFIGPWPMVAIPRSPGGSITGGS